MRPDQISPFSRQSFTLPKIYPITDRRLSGLPHDAQISRLAAAGAKFVQIREKSMPSGEFFAAAVKAVAAARKFNITVLINDRVDIALMARADGVHLGQDDLPPQKAREILGETAIIGYSTHNLEQALAAAELPVDYIAVGPIFATSSKENPDTPIGLEQLAEICAALSGKQIVAIGGINSSNIDAALSAGADSVAMISGALDRALLSQPGT